MLVFGELLAGRLEHAPDALSAGGDVRQRAFRLPHFRVEPCQVAAVEASHALAHRVDAGAQAFDALAGSPRLTASLVTQTPVERLPFVDLADHAADRPCSDRRRAGLRGRVHRVERVDRVTGRLVVAIAGGDGTQLAHASGLFLHASEVRVVTLVILHGRTGQVQRLGHAQHALFEDVVKAGGGVGRLDAGQQTACLRAQAHDIPNVGVEHLGVREGDAPRIRGFQLRGRERRLAEHVHAARVDRLVPCQVQPSDVAAPVAGHQIEELAAGQYLTGGEVAVGVDDRAPYGPGRAGLVPAAQVHRFVDAVGASHADHAAQVGVVASFRTPRIRRLVEGRAGRVEQRYLRVDQRRLAGFARAGE